MKKLTYEDFIQKYTLEYNQILLEKLRENEDTGEMLPEDMCDFGGCMYETFGKELEYVVAQPKKRIFTIVEAEDDRLLIISGYHIVNRFGYLIADEEWDNEYEEYEV